MHKMDELPEAVQSLRDILHQLDEWELRLPAIKINEAIEALIQSDQQADR